MNYTIYRNDSRNVEYKVEPETGYTRNDIIIALQNGTAKLSGSQIKSVQEGNALLGTITDEESISSVKWS